MDEKIKNILLENDLGEYINTFEQNKLDSIDLLSSVTEADYEKMGITAMGDRKRLLRLFNLNEKNDQAVMKADASSPRNEPIHEKIVEKVVIEQRREGEQVIVNKSSTGKWIFFTVVVAIIMIALANILG